MDMMCMFDDILFMDDLPKYDNYDEDYTKVNSSKPSTTYCWEEEYHLQLKYGNQHVHIDHDNNEQNAENFKVREKYLPLCFSCFQFLRETYKQVFNIREGECFDKLVEYSIDDMVVVPNPEL